MIISLTGMIGSGKDTVADILVDSYGYRRESFAGSMKDAIAMIFGWDREMLEGKTKEARAQRDVVDTWWADRLDIPHLTPRWVFQNFGTEVCRKHFHDDIWIAALENKLRKSSGDIVISDARFPNELAMIKRLGGTSWCIERGEQPEWFNYAKEYNTADEKTQLTMRMIASIQPTPNVFNRKIHSSEWVWVGYDFDQMIDNDGSIADLVEKTKSLIVGH